MDLFLVYAVCLGVGLLFTILSAFMSHVFGGHDVGHDAHSELGTGGPGPARHNNPGSSPFSPPWIASLVPPLRGFGLVFFNHDKTQKPPALAPLSRLSGV